MSSTLIIPVPPAKLARAAWFRVIGVLLLGLLAAVALAFYGYELYRLNGALSKYQQAMLQHQMRTEAINRLSEMDVSFNRYLLDGNSANTGLIQADKQRIEQLGQATADSQNDKLLQGSVATEQKWYAQAVQPLIEERRKLAAGQGLPEDFLAKYRAAPQDLQIVSAEIATENAHRGSAAGIATGARSITVAMAAVSAGRISHHRHVLAGDWRGEERELSKACGGESGRRG